MKEESEKQSGESMHMGMQDRGVTRPMALGLMKEGQPSGQQEQGSQQEQGHQEGQGGQQDKEQMRMHMLTEHLQKTQWIWWMVILLGIWLAVGPMTFSYHRQLVEPAGGRQVWLEASTRAWVLLVNDVVCGLLLVVLGWRSLVPNRPVMMWGACFVGIWLNFAPLLFWAPKAAIYLNDTLVGSLVIALTILIPGMPNMIHYMKMGPDKPPGWSYNPSSWPQRSIMIALGFAGWLVSRHLAMFQMGYITQPWEPFFGDGSVLVLTSKMSESLPISDGGLGALAYTFEFLMGWMGSPARWRTMPWMVTFFGILVIPLGLVHIFLVISQPVVVGHWCTFCLLAAAIMLPMIPLEIDEVIAMVQFMRKSRKKGESFWRVFWKGGTIEGEDDERTPEMFSVTGKPVAVLRASVFGMSVVPTLLIAAALGVWMMAVPDVLGNAGRVADVDHLAGALVVVVAIIALGEPVRLLRWLNLPLGLLIAGAAIWGSGATTVGRINDIVVGLAVVVLSIPRGRVKESFDTWDRWVR